MHADGTHSHHSFADLDTLLHEGDLLVLNRTRVIAARLFGSRPSGGKVEVLLLRPSASIGYDEHATLWHVLARPGKRLPVGAEVLFGNDARALVTAVFDEGIREMQFTLSVPFQALLQRHGRLPLPPYIKIDDTHAQERYQTIFAEIPGSVAAPTASLHFTSELFDRLAARGIQRAYVNLDVGIGTFRPMTSERIDDHTMHAEAYDIPAATVSAIRRAKEEGRRIVAAGTTVVRTLEGSVAEHGRLTAGQGQTNLFISPGFSFQVVDAMITNFHLPRSTLLVLVSAFAGRERILAAYREAVAGEYRFFSFGDAMLLEKEPSA